MNILAIGGLTKLAQTVINSTRLKNQEWFLLCRNTSDIERLNLLYPKSNIVKGLDKDFTDLLKNKIDAIICFTIGTARPIISEVDQEAGALVRDIDYLHLVLNYNNDRTLSITFISSILALVPKNNHTKYSGWKCVAEGELKKIIGQNKKNKITILYPGRLVEKKSILSPLTIINTTYTKLSKKIAITIENGKDISQVVGIDARLLLIVRGFFLIFKAIVGKV